LPVPARYLIKVDRRLQFEELAPLTDAGLTPYRGIKKLWDFGALGPNRVLGVFGTGGLGGYAVQYARLLGGGTMVVAFARNPDKLAIVKEYGVDHIISIKGKSAADISAAGIPDATCTETARHLASNGAPIPVLARRTEKREQVVAQITGRRRVAHVFGRRAPRAL
jgi:D-arabinose 1-dehydrogenase-like Zn-dependent alcohol dehydrogenase